MTASDHVFLSLLRDHVQGGCDTTLPEDMDWDALFRCAEAQSLVGVCYAQLKKLSLNGKNVPDPVLKRFHEGFYSDVWSAANQRAAMAELMPKLKEAGIISLPFKGWVVRQSWPVPELRTMGDIDILIHGEDQKAVDDILVSQGFQRKVDHQAVWSYFSEYLMLEIHNRMLYEHIGNDVDYIGYFDHAWEHASDKLDPDFHMLFLITHLAKHIVNCGMGFRGFLDLVFYARGHQSQLHWICISKELEKLKLLRFTETCYAFCLEWFGAEPPIPVKTLDPEFSSSVTEKMFRDGTFGLDNEQNADAKAAREISHSGGSYWSAAIKLTLHRVFPPYEDLQLVPWYAFLDGRPWLLPVAWVYRWYYVLKHKQKKGKAMLLEPYENKSDVRKRQQFIHDWGI